MTKTPHADEGFICPFHKEDMSEVCHKCPMWVQVRGRNPQNGQEIDDWRCSLTWLPLLLIETASQTRQTGAAIESFRNEVVRAASQAARVPNLIQTNRILPRKIP